MHVDRIAVLLAPFLSSASDQRLTAKGIRLGCVGSERAKHHGAKMAALDSAQAMARSNPHRHRG